MYWSKTNYIYILLSDFGETQFYKKLIHASIVRDQPRNQSTSKLLSYIGSCLSVPDKLTL